jgi:hypothetical protein
MLLIIINKNENFLLNWDKSGIKGIGKIKKPLIRE